MLKKSKRNFFVGIAFICLTSSTLAQNRPFITTWRTTIANDSITLPLDESIIYDYDVDWGDGTIEYGLTGSTSHTYLNAGDYDISITGTFPRFRTNSSTDKDKLIDIKQWGDIEWNTFSFSGCSNLTMSATDAPDLSHSSQLTFAFTDCKKFNGDLSGWDVSTIHLFGGMFSGASSFNGDISTWNTSKASMLSDMFKDAESFNCDISGWDLSNISTTSGMFQGATSFNADISGWNLSSAYDISEMFKGSLLFDQDLSGWDISNVKYMEDVFDSSGMSLDNYDKTLIGWASQNVQPNVTVGAQGLLFCESESKRELLINTNNWSFDGDEKKCEVKITIETTQPLTYVKIPYRNDGGNLSYDVKWGDGSNSSSHTLDASHLYKDPGTYEVRINGDYPSFEYDGSPHAPGLTDISRWGDGEWTSMESAFEGCINLIVSATDIPDVSSVSDFSEAFKNAASFNTDISNWNMSSAIDLSSMFSGASSFNQSLSNWNTSQVTNMESMLHQASSFNKSIGSLDIRSVTSMALMLTGTNLSVSNYDNTLSAWAHSKSTPSNITLGAYGLEYCAASDRAILVNSKGWTIWKDSMSQNCSSSPTPNPNKVTDSFAAMQSKIVYPNPVTDRLKFISNESATYKVVDISGRVFKSETTLSQGTNDIDVSQLIPGIYLLVVGDQEYRFVKK